MKYLCNPLKLEYKHQYYLNPKDNTIRTAREAADPSIIYFKGKYYLFASMSLGVWSSNDLKNWKYHRLPDVLPLYDYAPDARVIGEYVYFSASKAMNICHFYRTKDIENGPYEKIDGTFPFWDPALFEDEDGSVYFYWGSSDKTPLWGIRIDPETMRTIGERQDLIVGNPNEKGFERYGENHCGFDLLGNKVYSPYIEGLWMNKINGKYYLQYAAPGTELNIYCDAVYVSDKPLGPFVLADNNPFFYHPGSFMPGAGHGSTFEDTYGNLWHASTMRISVNHNFERRIGIWPAGVDEDGELFCNQRFGDWPMQLEEGKINPWKEPEWYLLNKGKK